MDTNKQDKMVTEQGLGSPVPVGAGSGRAGSPRPSSIDCHAPVVEYQAGELVSYTGFWLGKTGKNRNKKSLKAEFGDLQQGGSVSAPTSPNIATLDYMWDEIMGRSTKRKRAGELHDKELASKDEEDRIAAAIRGLVKSVDKEVRHLGLVVQENANTKKEIKEISVTLRSMLSRLMSVQMQDMLNSMGQRRSGEARSDLVRIEDKATMAKPPTREAGGQTLGLSDGEENKDDIIKALEAENTKLRNELRRMKGEEEKVTEELLEGQASYERFENLERIKWPSEIFKVAILAKGSPLRGNKETDLMVLEEEERWQSVNQVYRKAMYERFPELSDLEGRLAALTVRTRVLDRNTAGSEWERWIMKAEVDECKREWFNTLTQLRKMMVEGRRSRISIYPPGQDREGEVTRKMMEFIFRGSGIKCIIFIREGNMEGGGENRLDTRKTPENTEAFVVRREGVSYAELLCAVKSKVRPKSEAAGAIRTIRESRDGGMVIVLSEQSAEKKRSLLRELADLEGVTVKHSGRNREAIVTITDIGHDVTEGEILGVLAEELGLTPKVVVNLSATRPAFGGNRAITVRLPREDAEQLVKKGGLRIGLNWCAARIRVNVTRCFRCWQYGHVGRDCRAEEDGSNLCRRCGGTGHQASNCDGEMKCLTCKQVGHLAGSGRCPEFRKALDRVRQRARKRKKF